MTNFFGEKGIRISRIVTAILMIVIGLFNIVIACKMGFVLYLLASLFLIIYGYYLYNNED